MCGIAGKLNFDGKAVDENLVRMMTRAIAHRGPDDEGYRGFARVGLGHRRLSIIDLAGGNQPICNENGNIWLVYNGEIYNFLELREDLVAKGHHFATQSDTEVIIHLYEEYGVDCLRHLNGMFAIALWDEARERLLLARDRMGKKPIVYSIQPDALIFASEIGALLQDSSIPRQIDLEALDLYLTLSYVPSPWTMLQSVRKLPPAHFLLWEAGQIRIEPYWQLDFTPQHTIDERAAIAEIRSLLEDSVRRRLISDVPLGAFLSGGVDSSTVVALMSRLTGSPVRTFSIGFDDDVSGELPYAREVAQRFGCEHTELLVKPQMVDIVPRLVRHYGEPYGDTSAVPTYYVSQLAGESVKVVLSGDGGDEVFGGYPWYVNGTQHIELAHSYMKDGLDSLNAAWQQRRLRPMLGAVKGTAVGLGVALCGWQNPARAFERLITYFSEAQRHWLYTPDVSHAVREQRLASTLIQGLFNQHKDIPLLTRMISTDHHLYLPDDILVKVDIASMANSLEVRSPFLDYRLVEFCAALPSHMKVAGSTTKRILRQVVADLIPETVLNRPKVGFGMPVNQWMRDDLYPMAHDLLLDPLARTNTLFDTSTVRDMLERHKRGTINSGYHLWILLMVELWWRELLDDVPQREPTLHRAYSLQ